MEIQKTICFFLPDRLDLPVGGHKVVYQYANYLCEQGYLIIIANNIHRPAKCHPVKEFIRKIYSCLRHLYRCCAKKNTCRGWFPLDPSVREISVWSFHGRYLPASDFYVATNALTAPFLMECPVPDAHKIYFIQGYENWLVNETFLFDTYRLPVKKVAVAGWLANEVAGHGDECLCVSNGYDGKEYFLTVPIARKDSYSISMLYHTMPSKNCEMAIRAFDIVKSQIPELKVVLFGVSPRPAALPPWYEYHQNPDSELHNRINNECSIYVGPSSSEGFCLTILEAMACGQAVACTDIPGYREVARHNDTALISPNNDFENLANNILRLINDNETRIRLATSGFELARRYKLELSCEKFKSLLH